MAQSVLPVDTIEYNASLFDDLLEGLLDAIGYDPTTQGPLRANSWGYNTLAVSGAASPLSMASGAGWVKGKLCRNTAAVDIAIDSPAAATRIDLVVLKLNFAVSPITCVLALHAGAEGGACPSPTQTDGTTWELPLAEASITTGGAVTITDRRQYVGDGGILVAMLAAGILSADTAGRAKIAANYFNDTTVLSKFATDSFTAAVLLQLIQDGAFAADAATRALFANNIWQTAHIADDQITVGKLAHSIDATAIGFDADKVDGQDAADLIVGGVILGMIVMWSGTLGGTDGHRPIVATVPDENWHLCNGDLVGSVQTPDMRDRFPVCAGTSYNVGNTGGSNTVNIAHVHAVSITSAATALPNHTHAPGTLAAVAIALASHVHEPSPQTSGPSATMNMPAGTGATWGVPTETHVHPIAQNTGVPTTFPTHGHTISGNTGNPNTNPTHTHLVAGNTASGGSASVENRPPYYGVYFIMKVA